MYSCQIEERTAEERDALILEHLPQVRIIARRIHERIPEKIAIDDLISNGVIGLIAAIDNFDPSQNVKLKTYSEHRIRGAILDGLRSLDWAPRQKRRMGIGMSCGEISAISSTLWWAKKSIAPV